MLLVTLIFLVVALVLIGVGLAVGLVACVLGACLISLGIVSSSVLIGVSSRRPAWGLRAFFLQCGVLAGALFGAMGTLLAQSVFSAVDTSTWTALVGGASGGAVGGACVALLLDLALRRLHGWPVAHGHYLRRQPLSQHCSHSPWTPCRPTPW